MRKASPSVHSPVKFSFIVPSLNEERHIARVVSQFKVLEGHYSYEVVIGDGGSTDRTGAIAAALGAKFVVDESPVKTVASGRNAGAGQASGEILVFCDADTWLSDVVGLMRATEELFSNSEVVAAIPRMEVFPEQQIWKDKIFQSVFNNFLRASFLLHVPFSRGQCQIIRASAFRKVGGYNGEQVHADDNTIFQQLAKVGKLRFINDYIVYESPRRYRKVGYLKLSGIGVTSIIGQQLLGRNILDKWERVD